MNPYFIYSIVVLLVSLVGLFAAYVFGMPLGYAAIIPGLAGACIAAFKLGGAKK